MFSFFKYERLVLEDGLFFEFCEKIALALKGAYAKL